MGRLSRFIFRHGRRVDVPDRTTAPAAQPQQPAPRDAAYDKDVAAQYRRRRKTALNKMFGMFGGRQK